MALSRDEQESIVRVGFGDETLTFSTTMPKHARHMERLGIAPEQVTCIDGEPVSWVFKVDAQWFKLPRPKKRVSESQRQAAAERMRARFAEDEEDGEDDE